MHIHISPNLTDRWIRYLNTNGQRWNKLLPFMYILGITVALVGDTILLSAVLTVWALTSAYIFIKYTVEKNQDDNTLWTPPRNKWLETFIYAIAPLKSLGKLIHDTFKPFKYGFAFEVIRTLEQPIEGLALILTGIWRAFISPLITVASIFLGLVGLIAKPSLASVIFRKIPNEIGDGVIRFINGLARILAGSVELALTPFTFLVKPGIRFAIGTTLNENEKPNIINNNGIKSRIAIAQTKQIKWMESLNEDENLTDNFRLSQHMLHVTTANIWKKPDSNSTHSDDMGRYIIFTYTDIHRKFLKSLNRGERVDFHVVNAEAEHYRKLTEFSPDTDKSINENWTALNTLKNNYAGLFFNNVASQENVAGNPIEVQRLIAR